MTLTETTLGDLRGYDLTHRIVVTVDGEAVDGEIVNVDWINYYKGVQCYKLIVKEGEHRTVTLTNLPLDYIVQVER